VAAALLDEGISVSTAEPFATSKHVPHAIRLALGAVGLDRLHAALQTVKRRVDEQDVLIVATQVVLAPGPAAKRGLVNPI
jgi:hypothetical protein